MHDSEYIQERSDPACSRIIMAFLHVLTCPSVFQAKYFVALTFPRNQDLEQFSKRSAWGYGQHTLAYFWTFSRSSCGQQKLLKVDVFSWELSAFIIKKNLFWVNSKYFSRNRYIGCKVAPRYCGGFLLFLVMLGQMNSCVSEASNGGEHLFSGASFLRGLVVIC